MAKSLEIRAPFLDADVVSAALALGDQARRPTEPPKRFLTDIFDDFLPEEFTHRPRERFTLPMEQSMMKELRDTHREAIGRLATHHAFSAEDVRAVRDEFLDGHPRYTRFRPWLLVALGASVDRYSLA